MAFTRTWSITAPADTDLAKYGARDMRYFRVDIQERVAVEHSFAGDASDGVHSQGSARAFRQSATPSDAYVGRLWWDTATSLLKMGDGAIYTAMPFATENLGTGSVTSIKLATDSVTSIKIVDGNVTTTKLANLAVTEAKIANLAVTNAKLANSSVDANKLAGNSVTTAKILDGQVTLAKLETLLQNRIGPNHVSTYRTGSNQTLLSQATHALQWNAHAFIVGSMHSTTVNNTRFTVPAGYGYCRINGSFYVYLAVADYGDLTFNYFIRKNGTTQVGPKTHYSTSDFTTNLTLALVPKLLACVAGDYFEIVLQVTDLSGATQFYLAVSSVDTIDVEMFV